MYLLLTGILLGFACGILYSEYIIHRTTVAAYKGIERRSADDSQHG